MLNRKHWLIAHSIQPLPKKKSSYAGKFLDSLRIDEKKNHTDAYTARNALNR